MDELESDFGIETIVKLRHHSNPNDDLYMKEVDERAKLYERKAYPTIAFNGLNVTRRGMTEKEIDSAVKTAWSMPTLIKLILNGTFRQESEGARLDFEAFATQISPMGQSNLRYAFFLFEDNLEREDQYFQHVVRGIKPSAKGISTRLAKDTQRRLSASFDLQKGWIEDELGCVCAIFDGDTMEVFAYGSWKAKAPHIMSGITEKWDAGKPLTVLFDKEIDGPSFSENTVLLVDNIGNTVIGRCSVNGKSCDFTPNTPLTPGTSYTLYLRGGASGIHSTKGINLVSHAIFQFIAEQKEKSEPILSVNKTTIDFGDIDVLSDMPFEVRNSGNEILKGSVITSEAWLKVDPTSFEVRVGDSKEIIVTVDISDLKSGNYTGKIDLFTNGGNLTITVSFRYENKESLIIATPNVLDFGSMSDGEMKTLSFTLKSQTSSVKLKGTCKSQQDWIVIEPFEFECEGCSFNVTVSPTIQGELIGEINIESNSGATKVYVKVLVKPNTPLSIVITNPAPGAVAITKTSSFTVIGTTSPGAIVSVNTKAVIADKSGLFNVSVTLVPGKNKLEVVSKNSKGDSSKISFEVIFEISVELWLGKLDFKINGKILSLITAPTVSSPPLPKELNGNAYMPIREVAETLGATVDYESKTKKVTLTQNLPGGRRIIELWINKTSAKINGIETPIHSSGKLYPTIIGGKTLLPLRFVGEALGASVSWSQSEKKITLVYPK